MKRRIQNTQLDQKKRATKRKSFRLTVGASILGVSAAVFAWCPPWWYNESPVVVAFVASVAKVEASIAMMDASLASILWINSQRLTSAIAVLTKQKAVAANIIGESSRESAEATALALKTLGASEALTDSRFLYGGEFGQGAFPCTIKATREIIANRASEMGEETRQRLMSEVVAAPGRYVDASTSQKLLADDHRANYCTQAQVDSGMCTSVGAMAGKSLNVATLFEPVMEVEDTNKAKIAFVNNVAGIPDSPIPAAAAQSAAAADYALEKSRKDALISPALTSFKAAQLDNTGITTAHSGSDIPLAMRFDREVKRYLGNSAEYEQWTKIMVGQNERGLLVEMLKIKALDLALLEKQLRQYERIEANLAVLTAGELQSQQAQSSSAAMRATNQSIKRQIQ